MTYIGLGRPVLECFEHLRRAGNRRTVRLQAELAINLVADRICDATDDPRHLEDVLGDLSGHDVAVVALRERAKRVHVFNPGSTQSVDVDALADDGFAA